MLTPFTSLDPVPADASFYKRQSAQLLYQIVTGEVTVQTTSGGATIDVSAFQPQPGDVTNPRYLKYKAAYLLYAIVSGQVIVQTS